MLYDVAIKNVTLDTLTNRVSSVTSIVLSLLEEGYLPNKSKHNKLQIGLMLISAFESIDVLTVEQHRKLENLYNKFISI